MAQAMINNRIYDDLWFFSLSQTAKWLFIFLITNRSCNLIGCYEIPLPIISSYTGVPSDELSKYFEELKEKIIVTDGWIIIKNYEKYNPMRNPSIEVSKQKQIKALPKNIKKIYDTLSTPCPDDEKSFDTPIGNGIGKETERKGIGNETGNSGREKFLEERKRLRL